MADGLAACLVPGAGACPRRWAGARRGQPWRAAAPAGAWLRHQIARYRHLHDDQRRLLGELGLTEDEVDRSNGWPRRRRPAAEGLEAARAHAARHGHLALSAPAVFDGFPLGAWLASQRTRQRRTGHLTRLGRTLTGLDAWWDPPWPLAWQRMWWTCRHHHCGLPEHLRWWPGAAGADHAGAWLHQQQARRLLLQPGQRDLLDELTALAGGAPGWRPRISDSAWQTLHLRLPPLAHHGGRRRDERQVLEAILHIACTQQPWAGLPQVLGPAETSRRYHRCHTDGTLTRISHARRPETDARWQQQLTDHLASFNESG
ncbi:transposase [Streptomyces sp. NPDC058122]|uniref:transposase n=1 Tax=Streptomyces sp. NPDC058122 TaxID=3346349 RepID=UPI0036EA4E2B